MMLSSSMEELERLSAEISLGILRWLKAMSMARLQFMRPLVGLSVVTFGATPGLTSLINDISALHECVCFLSYAGSF